MTQFEEQLQLEPSGYLFETHRIGRKGRQSTPLNVADSNPELHEQDTLVTSMMVGVQSELLPQPPLFTEQEFNCTVLDVVDEVDDVNEDKDVDVNEDEDVDVTDEVEEVVDPIVTVDEVVVVTAVEVAVDVI